MSISYSTFFPPTQLTASVQPLYTLTGTATTLLLRGGRIRFTNTSAGPVTVTAHAVPSGGSPTDANAFLKGKSVAANDYLDVDVPIIALGGSLQASASAATSITAHMISGGLFA